MQPDFDTTELARRLGACYNTAKRVVASGEIEAYQLWDDGPWRISEAAFEAYKERRTRKARRPVAHDEPKHLARLEKGERMMV